MTEAQDAIVDALQAQYAAVYLYGVVDAYVAAIRKDDVATYVADHRAERDALGAELARTGANVPIAAPAYQSPEPITDPVSAARVAAKVEDDLAAAYRNMLEKAESNEQRRTAVGGLGQCAVRGARWRVAVDEAPPTDPFPGAGC